MPPIFVKYVKNVCSQKDAVILLKRHTWPSQAKLSFSIKAKSTSTIKVTLYRGNTSLKI